MADPAVEKALFHRTYVLKELLDSEVEYVRRLRVAVEGYMDHIQAGGPDISPQLKADMLPIFSNLREIYGFHRDTLLPRLQKSEGDCGASVRCFLDHSKDFGIYLKYCKNKPTSDTAKTEHEPYFNQRQTDLATDGRLTIDDLLIAPVQRFTKYQLLMRDLLKDTKKAKMETTSIEEALELMKRIPKKTNDIICVNLLRGIPRSSLITHGSLWRQETLQFFDLQNLKAFNGDPRQVFLFDHRILVAQLADEDGYFNYEMSVKTLRGTVSGSVQGDSSHCKFSFTTSENNDVYHFQTPTVEKKIQWVGDMQSILSSQSQMMRALVFGTPRSKAVVRSVSNSISWSGSDSSLDSLPSEPEESGDEDWPQDAGFHRLKPVKQRTYPEMDNDSRGGLSGRRAREGKLALRKKRDLVTKSLQVPDLRPSLSFNSPAELRVIGDSRQQRGHSFSFSPILSARLRRKSSNQGGVIHVPFPFASPLTTQSLKRSPGAFHKWLSPKSGDGVDSDGVGDGKVWIGRVNQPHVVEQCYKMVPGQVFLTCDTSLVDMWRVRVMSGEDAGRVVLVQKNCLEEYRAQLDLLSPSAAYKVKRDLGSGRFSKVKLVLHRQTSVSFALKILYTKTTTAEQFHRELCIGCRLRHCNLVSYLEGIGTKDYAIVMERLDGLSLLDYLVCRGRVSEAEVIPLVRQLLDALEYLHSKTVLHLDVRPQNVMVLKGEKKERREEGGVVKLVDLGAARHWNMSSGGGSTISSSSSLLNHACEDPADYQYVAPEVFHQQARHPGTDVWGVGVILFIILYGESPFLGETSVRTVANVTSLRYECPASPTCGMGAKDLISDIFVECAQYRPSAASAKEFFWMKNPELCSGNFVNIRALKKIISNSS